MSDAPNGEDAARLRADRSAAYQRLLRRPDDPDRPAFLELFFDLVYVFALTQLTHLLIKKLNWQGAFEAAVLLLALWWIWVLTAWLTDQFDPQHPAVQWHVVVVMLGILLMAILVPEAFGEHGLYFAVLYVAINFGRGVFIRLAARGTDLTRRVLRTAFWFTLSTLLWIPGALVEGWARAVLWLLALSVDYVSAALRWPTPRLGRAPLWELDISEAHLAERYRQVFIIALGEIVLIMGLTFSDTGPSNFTPARTAVLVLSFASAALIWRLYIYRAGAQLASAIRVSPNPHRLSQSASYLHTVMVAGIILTAVGFTLIIENPTEQPPVAWIAGITGGPALFLAGRTGFEYLVYGQVTAPRLLGIAALGILSAFVVHLPPEVTSGAATLVLAAVAVAETARHRRHPRSPTPPATSGQRYTR
ncbi:low temperature requirement protein A [Micromonospora krabiensis]|uniref:Low temperature requirement protein LtrA n=1 Tax=Micromonospora krabiensis TaxID=307121 RepID=A0A1C3N342_9ACTN|nr:low temperature requirement protein A [Micromonospora krabiensis]SBV27000.1 Low temperature requirement protein LtrA [Micromonospora krabiensis]